MFNYRKRFHLNAPKGAFCCKKLSTMIYLEGKNKQGRTMTEREQREVLEHARAMIKRTWLRNCLSVKITRKRATYDRPAEWRMWVYAKGLPTVLEDGCSNGYLLRAENYDGKVMAQKLVSIAMTSPFAKDYIEASESPEFPHSNKFCMLAVGNNEDELTFTNFICDNGEESDR